MEEKRGFLDQERHELKESYAFKNSRSAALVLGANDRNLGYLELLLATELFVKGTIVSASDPSFSISPFFSSLEKLAEQRGELSEAEIFMEFQAVGSMGGLVKTDEGLGIAVSGKTVWPKSPMQENYIKALRSSQVVLASGPAGTGKTFLAVAHALSMVLSGKKNKIVLTRPALESGESLGFLPGDLSQKLNPYLKPLYDAMEYLIPPSQIKRMEEGGIIEISPLAYMRGRSINHSVVILDEAQNATKGQMKMFLTRLGEDSQAVITGDPSQIDLPHPAGSGLLEALHVLKNVNGVEILNFSAEDTVRSRIVRDIIKAYGKVNSD